MMYIRDNKTGKVRKYGTKSYDTLVISNDGSRVYYYNRIRGIGSKDGSYSICDANGETPYESGEPVVYADMGG